MPVSSVHETLVSGMIANTEKQEAIANNLANVNTVGFKRDRAVFKSFSNALSDAQIRSEASPAMPVQSGPLEIDLLTTHDLHFKKPLQDGNDMGTILYEQTPGYDVHVKTEEIRTAFTQGQLKQTGNDLDLSIVGDGFFAVEDRDGGVAYTRSGNFMLDNEKRIVTSHGNIVYGEGADLITDVPIVVEGKDITILEDGNVVSEGVIVGKLRVLTFDNPLQLTKKGDSLYSYEGSAEEIQPDKKSTVHQGYLETSNVNSVSEMVELLANTRQFELEGRSMKAVEQTLQRAIAELGKFK